MRHVLRAALAGASLLSTAPAHATPGAFVLTCVVTFETNGTGSGSCNATGGTTSAALYVNAAGGIALDFVYSASFPVCPLAQGQAQGIMNGVVGAYFAWTWVGPHGAFATQGDVSGGGYSDSVPIVGSPCAAPQTSVVVIEFAGT
jgi:hypothetical protein